MKKATFAFLLFLSACAFAQTSGVLFCPGGNQLYTEKDDGCVECERQVEAVAFVEVESTEPEFFTLVTRYKRTYYDIPFYKVTFDNKKYFVRKEFLAFGENLCSVAQTTTLFQKPRISAFSGELILEDWPVVAGKTVEHARHSFTEIQYFALNSGNRVKTAYVLSDKLKEYSEAYKTEKSTDIKEDFDFALEK